METCWYCRVEFDAHPTHGAPVYCEIPTGKKDHVKVHLACKADAKKALAESPASS